MLSGPGCIVHRYGVERMGPGFHEALMLCGPDPTAQFLRFQPDEALVVLSRKQAHLCEVKSKLPDTNTGNIAYELASIQTALRLAEIGISVFVVFGNLKAAWPRDIVFSRRFDTPEALARITRGSRTPFGLFSQDAPFLKPLVQFASEELGC